MPSDLPFPARLRRARRARPVVLAAGAISALAIPLAGCHRKHTDDTVAATPVAKARPTISEIDLKSYKPNEAGAVMILMYHRFDPKLPSSDKVYNRRPDDFRKDLEDLYKRGYRPATASEYVDNNMDVPIGKTPVVLTFDDSWDTQFKLITGADGQQHIDPDCAVGIMETFEKQHPDWKSKGTFFVLPHEGTNPEPFYQPESSAEKMSYLLKHGYEIQNHTSTHHSMRGMPADKVQWELATAVKDIKGILKDAQMDILALPYGQLPHKDAVKYLEQGSSGGSSYKNRAVFLAAYRPVASPVTYEGKKTAVYQIAPFIRYHLERVKPAPEQAKLPGTFEYWLKWFDDNPSARYVSDGNPALVSVPKSLARMVDPSVVKKEGKELFAYSMGGSNGGGLSVEASAAGSTGGSGNGLSVEPAPAVGGAKGGNLGVESTTKR